MPLNNTRLGRAIAATMKNARPDAGQEISDADLETLRINVANDIIDEIKQGTVTTTVTGTATTSLGPAPVTGSGTGTIAGRHY